MKGFPPAVSGDLLDLHSRVKNYRCAIDEMPMGGANVEASGEEKRGGEGEEEQEEKGEKEEGGRESDDDTHGTKLPVGVKSGVRGEHDKSQVPLVVRDGTVKTVIVKKNAFSTGVRDANIVTVDKNASSTGVEVEHDNYHTPLVVRDEPVKTVSVNNTVLSAGVKDVKVVTVNLNTSSMGVREEGDIFGRGMTPFRRSHTKRDTQPLPLKGEDEKAVEWGRRKREEEKMKEMHGARVKTHRYPL